MKLRSTTALTVWLGLFFICPWASAELSTEQVQFFRTKIEPVLKAECYKCHAQDSKKIQGEFLLHNRASLVKGGPSGKAIVPGKVADSLLISALKHVDFEMPPKKRLPDSVVKDFEKWIEMGAPDPRDGEAGNIAGEKFDYSKGRKFWSFQPLKKTDVPKVKSGAAWARGDIDRFILAKLEENKLKPNSMADRRTLLRRAYFDLVGLPPTPAELDKFKKNKSPKAFGQLVDQLLASPHYGERWGRHWLDLARFGESHGYEADNDRPQAFRYRDAVIKAWNDDLPFNKFVQWQIAGDEYEPKNDLAKHLTGFCGAGPTVTNEGGDRVKYEKLDDVVSTTGEALLGLSLGCARCHDHKYDPVSAKDYYQFAGVFNTMKVEGDGTIRDSNRKPAQNFLLYRGDFRSKSKIGVSFLNVLMKTDRKPESWFIKPPKDAKSTYLRRSMAEWITDTKDGAGHLLARVMVNRIWQHHFGAGIVRTSSDFGAQGDLPSHPELLDYLASKLIEGGWKIKPLHRLIMTSAVYQQSTLAEPASLKADPTNRLLARRRPMRLEAEAVRDNLLTVSGCLNRTLHGPSVKPWIPGDAIATGSTRKWPVNVKDGPKTWRRSVYIYAKRSMLMPMLQAFDFPDCTKSCAVRNITTIAPAALLLMNNDFVRDQARHFAERVKKEAGDDTTKQVDAIYRTALSRKPTSDEAQLGAKFLNQQAQSYAGFTPKKKQAKDAAKDSPSAGTPNPIEPEHRSAALVNYCQAVMGLNEFIYID